MPLRKSIWEVQTDRRRLRQPTIFRIPKAPVLHTELTSTKPRSRGKGRSKHNIRDLLRSFFPWSWNSSEQTQRA